MIAPTFAALDEAVLAERGPAWFARGLARLYAKRKLGMVSMDEVRYARAFGGELLRRFGNSAEIDAALHELRVVLERHQAANRN